MCRYIRHLYAAQPRRNPTINTIKRNAWQRGRSPHVCVRETQMHQSTHTRMGAYKDQQVASKVPRVGPCLRHAPAACQEKKRIKALAYML